MCGRLRENRSGNGDVRAMRLKLNGLIVTLFFSWRKNTLAEVNALQIKP
jgi:hypothetical protein